MPYTDIVRFDSLVVIETLGAKDLKTGEWLFESQLKPIAAKHGPFAIEFIAVHTKQEFLATLDKIHEQYVAQGHCPILHIEAHGSETGLMCGSGEEILWEEMREPLTAMNEVVGVNLLVVMALCNGAHLSRVLSPTKPAPAWGVLGPREPVKAGPLREAMATFYEVLFTTMNVRRAMDAMNDFAQYGEWEYTLETAEVMLFRVYKHILQHLSSSDQRQAQENAIVAEIVRRRGLDVRIGIAARHKAREMLADHKKHFLFFRHTFLMIDRWPENEERFTLSFEDCERLAREAA